MKFSNQFILPHQLNDIQHQIMIGGLLGDSSLEKSGKFPRMKIERQVLDKPYLTWQFSHFKNLCKSDIKEYSRYDVRYCKFRASVYFRTRAVPAFTSYYDKWYINGIKTVPNDIEFTPLVLAIWFCDDGCIINEKNQRLVLKLSTESFGYAGTNFLSQKLEKLFESKFPIFNKKKDQFIIKASTVSSQKFLKYILPDLKLMSMDRKEKIFSKLNLNATLTVGAPSKYRSLAFNILNLKSFTIKDILSLSEYKDESSLRTAINKFYKNNYLNRNESEEEFNLLKYSITDKGYLYFTNLVK